MQRLQQVSHIVEPTENTSPVIDAASRGVHFGLHTQSFGNLPYIGMPRQGEWKTTSRDPDEFFTQRHELIGQIHYAPVDGLIPYYTLCDKAAGNGGVTLDPLTTGDDDLKLLVPIDSGNTESFTSRLASYDGARGHYQDMTGCRVRQWSSHINYESVDKILLDSVQFDAQGFAASGSTSVADLPFANTDALADQKPFRAIEGSHYVKYDTGNFFGNGVQELAPDLLNFQHTVDNQNFIQYVDSNMKPSWINSGKRIIGLSWDMYRRDAGPFNVMNDYYDIASAPVNNGFTMAAQFPKSSTEYIEYGYGGIQIIDIQMNDANLNNREQATYKVLAIAKSIAVLVKDGVEASAAGFYGVV